MTDQYPAELFEAYKAARSSVRIDVYEIEIDKEYFVIPASFDTDAKLFEFLFGLDKAGDSWAAR